MILVGLMSEHSCPPCICGKRAPVQADRNVGVGPGSIAWSEHLEAWNRYAARYGTSQSAERVAERGGFGYEELLIFLRRTPMTWEPR